MKSRPYYQSGFFPFFVPLIWGEELHKVTLQMGLEHHDKAREKFRA